MLKFFRTMRRRLLESGKTRSYALYAIGEIVLIVVGILLALQISNWNETQKSKRYEQYLLGELLTNVKEDGEQIEEILAKRYRASQALQLLRSFIDGDDLPRDSFVLAVDWLLSFERFYPIRTAYEIAKSNGLSISDRALRSQVARYYEYEQNKVGQSIKDIEQVMIPELRFGAENFQTRRIDGVGMTFRDLEDPQVFTWVDKVIRKHEPNLSASLEKIEAFRKKNDELRVILEQALR